MQLKVVWGNPLTAQHHQTSPQRLAKRYVDPSGIGLRYAGIADADMRRLLCRSIALSCASGDALGTSHFPSSRSTDLQQESSCVLAV